MRTMKEYWQLLTTVLVTSFIIIGSASADTVFKVSNTKSTYGSNHNQVCVNEFGSGWEEADWTDLENYYSGDGNMADLISSSGLDTRKNAWVTRNGDQSYSSSRDYFASYHNHNKPSGYLAHDNINNYFLSLGSWNSSYYVLCKKEGASSSPNGSIRVTITPQEAITDGVKWSLREKAETLNSGATYWSLTPGIYTIHFKGAAGWDVPLDYRVEVDDGKTTTFTGNITKGSIGVDPILNKSYCVGFTKNFYVFELKEMPEEEQTDTMLDDLKHQVANTVKNILIDLYSPSSLLVSAATGGVATWINTTINFAQLVGASEQIQFGLFDNNGKPIGSSATVKFGDAVFPILFLKTPWGGHLSRYKLHLYTNYDYRFFTDEYDEKFTLDTDPLPGKVKSMCLYMLIPRSTSLTKNGNNWEFVQKSRGMEGISIKTAGDNYMFQYPSGITLGRNEYLINVSNPADIGAMLNTLLGKKKPFSKKRSKDELATE